MDRHSTLTKRAVRLCLFYGWLIAHCTFAQGADITPPLKSDPPWGYEDHTHYLSNNALSVTFGRGELAAPQGVAFISGKIYVADCGNHRVAVYSINGRLENSFGSFGSGQTQFNCPTRIAVDGEQRLFVVDSGNHRIQVFSHEHRWLYSIGSYGNSPGSFTFPQDIAVNSTQLLVLDHNGVQSFDLDKLNNKPDGWLIKTKLGIHRGSIGIATGEDDSIYLTNQYKHTITQFNAQGKQLQQWGERGKRRLQFNLPSALAIYKNQIVVADQGNHRYQSLSPQGHFSSSWGEHPPHSHLESAHIHSLGALTLGDLGMVACDTYQQLCQYQTTAYVKKMQEVDRWQTENPSYHPDNRIVGVGGQLVSSDARLGELWFYSVKDDQVSTNGKLDVADALNLPRVLGLSKSLDSVFVDDRGLGTINRLSFPDKGNGHIQLLHSQSYEYLDELAQEVNCRFGRAQAMVPYNDKWLILVDDILNQLLVVSAEVSEVQGCWGRTGTKLGEFNQPIDMLLRDNQLYVLERLNHRIQNITINEDTDGRIHFELDDCPCVSEQNALNLPLSIAASEGQLIVSQAGSVEYSVFSTNLSKTSRWQSLQTRAELKLPIHQLVSLPQGYLLAMTPGHHVGEFVEAGFVIKEIGFGRFQDFDVIRSEWLPATVEQLSLIKH